MNCREVKKFKLATRMERQPWSLLFLLFGILRALGAFPYRWRHVPGGHLQLEKSLLAIIWSCMMVVSLVSLSVSCLVSKPDQSHGITWTISTYILNYVTYVVSALFYPYMALRSPKLAHILCKLDQKDVPLRRRILGLEDFVQVLCVLGITASLLYVTYDSLHQVFLLPMTTKLLLYRLSSAICDFIIEITALTMALLLYFILKTLGHESEVAVMMLGSSPTRIPVSQVPHEDCPCKWGTTLRHQQDSGPPVITKSEREATRTIPPQLPVPRRKVITEVVPADQCRMIASRLLALDDIVNEVVEYGGAPVALVLLSSTVNATVMLYLTITKLSYYYLAYITLKVLSVLQFTFLPDKLCSTRERCLRLVRRLQISHVTYNNIQSEATGMEEVEKVLGTGARFIVCRLFTLDRHIILSVASSVVTYLVIALQFGFSEAPNTFVANCTDELG